MSEPGFVGLGDYHDFLLDIQNRGNHKIPLIPVQTAFYSPALISFPALFTQLKNHVR
jgi:hypothetical protein